MLSIFKDKFTFNVKLDWLTKALNFQSGNNFLHSEVFFACKKVLERQLMLGISRRVSNIKIFIFMQSL